MNFLPNPIFAIHPCYNYPYIYMHLSSSSDGKASTCKAGDLGLILGLGRSPGEGNGNPFQYSSLENSMDRAACQVTVHGGHRESDMTERLTHTHTHTKCGVVVIVQLLSCVRLFAAPWTAACQVSLPFTISQSLLKLLSIDSVMPSNHLVLCHPHIVGQYFLCVDILQFIHSPVNGHQGSCLIF